MKQRKEYNYSNQTIEESHPKWYTFKMASEDIGWDRYAEKYIDIVHWLYDTIGKCEHHVVWGRTIDEEMIVRFRYEKDYLHFMLRWS